MSLRSVPALAFERFIAHDGWAIASHIALSVLMSLFQWHGILAVASDGPGNRWTNAVPASAALVVRPLAETSTTSPDDGSSAERRKRQVPRLDSARVLRAPRRLSQRAVSSMA